MYICTELIITTFLGVCYDPIVEQSISHQPKSWVRLLNYNIEENVTKVLSVPIYRTPDEVGDINVSNLIRIFGSLALLVCITDTEYITILICLCMAVQ